MSAIISDQFRILNAENFIKSFTSVGSTANYYTFIGQPNSTNPFANGNVNWGDGPPPRDGFKEENEIKETIVSLKKINPSRDLRRVIRKVEWTSGVTYEMYRHDYTIYNPSPITNSPNLYNSNYYVVNDDLRVYICLQNGTDPSNPSGQPSFDPPTFVDLDPRPAGTSGDGYIWKYLFTIKPKDIIKFDSVEYIPVPEDWGHVGESVDMKNNAVDGKIEIITIKNRGSNYGPPQSYKNIPILGDGTGGRCTVIVNSLGEVSNIFVTEGGTGYTKGTVNFSPGGTGIPLNLTNTGTLASFDVIIPPKGGHGYNIYRELGAYRVLLYTRFSTDETNPDTIVGNDFARIGIIKNPTTFSSSTQILDVDEVSGLKSLKLVGFSSLTNYAVDSLITQTVGTGVTAAGFVASWNDVTGVLKYYQPVGLATAGFNYQLNSFTSTPDPVTGSLQINGSSVTGPILSIDTTFNGTTTLINNRTYQLGSNFVSGISSEEYNKKSGEIIYIDNRQPIPRSLNQKEDIKIILEF